MCFRGVFNSVKGCHVERTLTCSVWASKDGNRTNEGTEYRNYFLCLPPFVVWFSGILGLLKGVLTLLV